MGIVSSFFGGGSSGGGSIFDGFGFRPGGTSTGTVPRAPAIPDVIQPSDPRVQRAGETTRQRSTFLGRTRGGTQVRRATLLSPEGLTSATLLGGR